MKVLYINELVIKTAETRHRILESYIIDNKLDPENHVILMNDGEPVGWLEVVEEYNVTGNQNIKVQKQS